MSLHGNIKFVVENLIFENKENLVGKTIKINRLSLRLNKRIRSEISEFCCYDMTLKPISNRKLAIKKYGVLDLEFELTNLQVLKCNDPFQILRNENVLGKGESQNPDWREDSIDIMNFILQKDIKKMKDGKLYLKIFAESIGEFKSKHIISSESQLMKEIRYQGNQAKVEFKIIDACITNLPGVWFNKHFYW